MLIGYVNVTVHPDGHDRLISAYLSAPSMNARPLLPGLLLLREARLATLFMLSRGVRAPSRSWPPAQTS